MELSKGNRALIEAYNKGYRVINGEVHSPYNKTLSLRIKGSKRKGKYYEFSVQYDGEKRGVVVHRLVAYQKFGDKIFGKGIQVRHLDGNSLNNTEENIAIGTQSDNMLDRPETERKQHSIHAASHKRRFSDEKMKEIREEHQKGVSYSKLMKKFNISSLGTLHYMIKNQYRTTKQIGT